MDVGDGLVRLWDLRDGSYVKRLQGHPSEGGKNIHTYSTYIHTYIHTRTYIHTHTYILYMQKH